MSVGAQLELPLRWAPDAQRQIVLGRLMHCRALSCDLLPETCAARQSIGTHPSCVKGTCTQGLAVLQALGLVVWGKCPTCGGCGRVRADRVGP